MQGILSPALCYFEAPYLLIFNSSVAPLVYYSHLPIFFVTILLAFFIIFKNKNDLASKILFVVFLSFAVWTLLDSIFWASNRSDVIMFVWSVILIVEPLIYVGALYLLYVFIEKKDLAFLYKALLFAIYLPIIIFVPTRYGLSGFDLNTCLGIEGPIALYYTYFVEILMSISIIIYSIYRYKNPVTTNRKELVLISTGIILFLSAFAWGNITGSFTENWQLGQFGLFGMPVFAGFLVYSIVKYKTFNIKLIGAQALVVSLWIALAAMLFVRTIENVRTIISLTLILFLIIGILLIRSVAREVKQREEMAKMAEDVKRAYIIEKRAKEELEKLDKFKDQFLMTTQHNLRTPLTSMMGYSDLLLKGIFGKQNKKTIEVIKKFQVITQGMIKMVNDFLNMAQFQLGKDVVALKPGIEISAILNEIITELEFKAKSKNLYLKLEQPEKLPALSADREKLKAALFNIIDNAIKYTPKGGVDVKVENGASVKIIVSDTGIGIPEKEVKNIFDTMFSRGEEAKKLDTTGSGVGLYLSGQIIKAHNGKVWVESSQKGSIFYIELPIVV